MENETMCRVKRSDQKWRNGFSNSSEILFTHNIQSFLGTFSKNFISIEENRAALNKKSSVT